MRKTIVAGLIAGLVLTGCSNKPDNNVPTPTPVPSVSETQSTNQPEPSPTPTRPEPQPTQPTVDPEPAPNQTTTEAGTPAVQFAQRWGKKYPAVPEFAILKAAKGVCSITETYPDWTNSDLAKAGITEIVTGFGLAENDGVEFTQDAQQNYCSSLSNPT